MNFKKHLLTTIGVPVGIILILAIALVFTGSDIAKRTDNIKRLRGDLLFRQQLTESLALLRKDSQQAQGYITELQNMLPSQDQLVSFPRDISTIARQNNIDLNATLGQESPGSVGKLMQTEFIMSGTGSFDNFITFLKSIETARYFISLKSLDFGQQENNFKGVLTGVVFSL
jgi:Tfp pilus assembly protein PilO